MVTVVSFCVFPRGGGGGRELQTCWKAGAAFLRVSAPLVVRNGPSRRKGSDFYNILKGHSVQSDD